MPGQTAAQLEADLAEVLALAVDHISWYELEIKPETALARMGAQLPDEDWAADAYESIVARLEAAGYRWYETANFARPGHECRHSLAYWSARDYLGLGVGAVSTVDGVRWRNVAGLAAYLGQVGSDGVPARTAEALDAATRRRERWMLGLRLDRPLDTAWAGPPDHPEVIARLEAGGLLDGGRRSRRAHPPGPLCSECGVARTDGVRMSDLARIGRRRRSRRAQCRARN